MFLCSHWRVTGELFRATGIQRAAIQWRWATRKPKQLGPRSNLDQKQLGPKATWTKSNLDRCPPAMLKIDLERAMEHRRFLAHPETHHPFAGGNLLGRIGGEAAIAALIEALYDRIETDPLLQPLFNR